MRRLQDGSDSVVCSENVEDGPWRGFYVDVGKSASFNSLKWTI